MSAIYCPTCGGVTGTIDTRAAAQNRVRRRRRCTNEKCGTKITTFEQIVGMEKPGEKTVSVDAEVNKAVKALKTLQKYLGYAHTLDKQNG